MASVAVSSGMRGSPKIGRMSLGAWVIAIFVMAAGLQWRTWALAALVTLGWRTRFLALVTKPLTRPASRVEAA